MNTRILVPADSDACYSLRLEALQDTPRAFGMTLDEQIALGPNWYNEQLSADPANAVIAGTFIDNGLAAVAAFFRQTGEKRRHKALIWGVYVSPIHRRQGLARRTLACILEHLRADGNIRIVQLQVDTENTGARALYLLLGFKSYGLEREAMRVDGQIVDEELMSIEI